MKDYLLTIKIAGNKVDDEYKLDYVNDEDKLDYERNYNLNAGTPYYKAFKEFQRNRALQLKQMKGESSELRNSLLKQLIKERNQEESNSSWDQEDTKRFMGVLFYLIGVYHSGDYSKEVCGNAPGFDDPKGLLKYGIKYTM